MARAEYAGLGGFFGGAGEVLREDIRAKRAEKSALRGAIADLYARQMEEGLLAREVPVTAPPEPVRPPTERPSLPMMLSQRLETGVPPRVTPEPIPTPVPEPIPERITELRPLTADEQIDVFKSIYGKGKLPKGIRVKDVKEAETTPIFYSDPVTKKLYKSSGEEHFGNVPKGSKIIKQSAFKDLLSLEEKLEFQAKQKELSTSLQLLPRLDQAVTAVKNLKELFYKAYTPLSVEEGDIAKGLAERARGLGARFQAFTGAKAELQAYLKARAAFSSLISKGGFGEAGMLTNQDIQRALNALPSPGDTQEEAAAKWRELENILFSARKRFQEKYKLFTGKEYGKEGPIKTKKEIKQYNVNDIINTSSGKQYKVIGFYEDGEPDVIEVGG